MEKIFAGTQVSFADREKKPAKFSATQYSPLRRLCDRVLHCVITNNHWSAFPYSKFVIYFRFVWNTLRSVSALRFLNFLASDGKALPAKSWFPINVIFHVVYQTREQAFHYSYNCQEEGSKHNGQQQS